MSEVVFGIPGVPFSSVRVDIDSEDSETTAKAIDRAVGVAFYVQKKYLERFPEAKEQPRQTTGRPQGRPQRPAPARRGTGYYCPDHDVEVFKTDPKYDKDGDRYYHPLPEDEWYQMADGRTAKNHNLYYRQLVDDEGNPLPPLDSAPGDWDDVPPPDDDDLPF